MGSVFASTLDNSSMIINVLLQNKAQKNFGGDTSSKFRVKPEYAKIG